jgi:hypothetical protein
MVRQALSKAGLENLHLFPSRLRLPVLSFRGTLEALRAIFSAASECFRARCFEEPILLTRQWDRVFTARLQPGRAPKQKLDSQLSSHRWADRPGASIDKEVQR